MKLKQYQIDTLGVIKAYFDTLDTRTPEDAYRTITESSLDMEKRLGVQRGYVRAAHNSADSIGEAGPYQLEQPRTR